MAQSKVYATGKRKTAIARVYIKAGTGRITVNGREFEDYFPVLALRSVVDPAARPTGKRTSVDVEREHRRRRPHVQAESVKCGIAKALQIENPELRTPLKRAGFLSRDARIKEREEKYGTAGGPQTVPVLQALNGEEGPEGLLFVGMDVLPRGRRAPAFPFLFSGE
jgi:small subunit ribosomal protein S9